MLRRYLARRKMRWAVREVARRKAAVLVAVVREARKLHHLSGRWGSDVPSVVAEKADRLERFYFKAYDELVSAAPAIINNWRELEDPWEPDD